MARLRARWNQSGLQRSYRDAAGVLAMNIWKLVCESLLNLENEGFAVQTYKQRLDILLEFAAYSLHLVDRMAHLNLAEQARRQLLVELAAKLTVILHDNYKDLGKEKKGIEYFASVIDKRGDDYAECRFDDDGPGFTLRRLLGEHVQRHVPDTPDDKDRQWLPDYVIEQEAPAVYRGICKTLDGLLAD